MRSTGLLNRSALFVIDYIYSWFHHLFYQVVNRNPGSNRHKQDKKEFEKIFKSHFISLCYFAQKLIGDPDTSRDVVHGVLLNLWERRNEIDFDSPIKPYLYTSVRNRCLNYIRDRKKFIPGDASVETGGVSVHSKDQTVNSISMEEQETEKEIQQAIAELPEKCREIFELNRFEGLKYQEVAKKLGISVKTVEAQMSKALRILRERLKDYLILLVFWFIWIVNTSGLL